MLKRVVLSFVAMCGLAAVTVLLSSSAVATGVIWGVFSATVVTLVLLNVGKGYLERQSSRTIQYNITHQHLHLSVDSTAKPEEITTVIVEQPKQLR